VAFQLIANSYIKKEREAERYNKFRTHNRDAAMTKLKTSSEPKFKATKLVTLTPSKISLPYLKEGG
jgi:hypothetical protein